MTLHSLDHDSLHEARFLRLFLEVLKKEEEEKEKKKNTFFVFIMSGFTHIPGGNIPVEKEN